jgi:dephospho-CoA kinase
MIVLGLTGSIGMGKTTTAGLFRELGIPVHDSDAAVHELYAGPDARIIGAAFPGTLAGGAVDRDKLARAVLGSEPAMRRLEEIVHPLVRARQAAFLENARASGNDIAVLDIPLLFETGADSRLDGVVVASCDAAEQRRRVLSRPGMTEEKFSAILSRQMPDAEKRARADFIVDTGGGFDDARRQVAEILRTIRSGKWRPRRN